MNYTCFRQVWRTISDGNGEVRVLVLQIWEPAKDYWHKDLIGVGGIWHDVPIINMEVSDNPSYVNSEE